MVISTEYVNKNSNLVNEKNKNSVSPEALKQLKENLGISSSNSP